MAPQQPDLGALTLADLEVLATGLDRPEAVSWGPDDYLYAGGCSGQVYRIDVETSHVTEVANLGGVVLGLCLDADAAVYACNVIAGTVLRVDPGGKVTEYSCTAGGVPYVKPNYCAFDNDGWLWLTDSGHEDPGKPTGRIVRIAPGGGDGEVISQRPLDFPNGLCLDVDGGLVFIESFGHGVSRLGPMGEAQPVVALSGVTPDGVAADIDGGLVIACYYPFRLLDVLPGSSSAEVLIDDPVGITLKMPTNITHFGPRLDRLAVASLAGSTIFALPAPRRGVPLRYPELRPTVRSHQCA